jgi:hypothetical protein
MNILHAMDDPQVFGPFFRSRTWDVWRCFLAVLFGQPLTEEQIVLYRQFTGRTVPPTGPSREAWLVIGRRGGKSFVLAMIAVFLACFRDWRSFLGPGEVGTVMVIAADRKQARVIMRYVRGLIAGVPMLAPLIEGETRETIELRNRIVIEVHTASWRSTRGYSVVAALLDELAFWPTDKTSAEPDVEVVNAIRPAMATIPDAILLCASSPHARRGALWDAHRRHYAQDGDPILVWQAATRDVNPSVPQTYIDQHVADDPARAAAEYFARFRSDLEAFVLRDAVEACISVGVRERPPVRGVSYAAFCDPSGGSSDSMTLCIGHSDSARNTIVIDCLRERTPPFSPENVVEEFSSLLRSYGIVSITGDKYAGLWPVEQFARFNILYDSSAAPKSSLYTDLLPLINSARIELLDHPKLTHQLLGLERRTARSGKDSIDHAPGQHDDLINSVAGVAAINNKYPGYDHSYSGFSDRDDDPDGSRAWRAFSLARHIAMYS